jgi:hypothetical protein
MKKTDYFLLTFVLGSLILFVFSGEIKIGLIFRFILALVVLGLFLYTKVKPVKNSLTPNLKKAYSIIEIFFDKVFNFMGQIIKPVAIGTNVSIDISQIIILIILLILLLL